MARCCGVCICIVALAVAVCWLVFQNSKPAQPRFYAAIAAVSGLDDLGRNPALDLEFTVVLGVASWIPLLHRGCLEGGTSVAVTHLGVPLAFAAIGRQACAELWEVQRETVVARGAMVRALPGSVLDSLAADVRRGVQVFGVTLQIPSADDHGAGKLVSCSGRRVGDVHGAMSTACDVHYAPN